MSAFACGFVAVGTCDVIETFMHLGSDTDVNAVLLAWAVLKVQWGKPRFCTRQTWNYATYIHHCVTLARTASAIERNVSGFSFFICKI